MNKSIIILILSVIVFHFVSSSNKDYIFDGPDISFDFEGINLKAFKSKKNDDIINNNKTSSFGDLRWISIGNPKLTQVIDPNTNEYIMFHFNDESFSLYFTMLTSSYREKLKNQVLISKKINVTTSTFVDLEPNSLVCYLKIRNTEKKKNFNLKGSVNDFLSSPYELIFDYPIDSDETILLKEKIKNMNRSHLNLNCTSNAGSSVKKTNIFRISLQESNKMGLEDKLFGDARETYVTRDQLTKLSQEVQSNINVAEDYQISNDQFSQIFVEDLIKLVANDGLKSVPFEEALKSISKYSFDFQNDIKANVIKEEIQNNFKIEKVNNVKHIKFDYEKFSDTMKERAKSSSISGEVSGSYGPISASVKASSSFAEDNKDRWVNSEKSLDDQLNELNTYNEGKIEFAFKGEKIYPKSLQVAKIQKSLLKKDLEFSRIKNFYYEYDSTFSFTLSTRKSNKIGINLILNNLIKSYIIKNNKLKI